MKRFTSKTQKIGELGEKICKTWLLRNGFTILESNYTKKEGEIDIIAKYKNTLHFIEVKSSLLKNVSYETTRSLNKRNIKQERYNPAENVTREKIKKCYKVINIYKEENNVSYETKTQFDVYIVYIDSRNLKHKIERIENIF